MRMRAVVLLEKPRLCKRQDELERIIIAACHTES
jgi:hypothetical protein